MAELLVEGFVAELIAETDFCVVDFPCPGGGALGVQLDPGGPVRVGQRIQVKTTVIEERPDTAAVTVKAFDGSLQPIVLDLGRVTVEKVVVEPAPVTPVTPP